MHDLVIQTLEKEIDEIRKKLPSMDESIKTYDQMAKNYRQERGLMIVRMTQCEEVIKKLKEEDDGGRNE